MTRNEKILIICNALFTLASGMSAVFVNVFLYTYTGSLSVMALYTCIRIAMFPIFFTIAGKLARKSHYGLTLGLGLAFFALQLIYVLMFNASFGSTPSLVYLAAMLYGMGEGFYYLSLNTLNQCITTPQSRNRYLSIGGVLNNAANVIAPLIASFIIDGANNDMMGYTTIFKIVLVVFVVIALLALSIKEKGNTNEFSVIQALSLKNDPQWKYVCMTYFLYGFRDSLVLALAGILVYNATSGSGSLYGKLLSFFSVLTILTYMFVNKYMVRSNRMKFYTIGAILLASSTIVLVLVPNIYGALYYGIVNAISSVLYSNPFQIITMNATSECAKDGNLVGRVIARETYLSVSRCLGMLFIVLCHRLLPENMYLYVSVLLLSLFPIILVVYSNRYHKKRDRLKRKLNI